VTREFDARTALSQSRIDARAAELSLRAEAVSSALPGGATIHVSRVDVLTGSAAATDASGFAPTEPGSFVDSAVDFLGKASTAIGLEPGQRPDFVANPVPVETSSGATSVYAQQVFSAIPIFQANQTVIFAPDRRLQKSTGVAVGIPPGAAPPVAPDVTVEAAVLAGARHLADNPPDEGPDEFGNDVREEPLSVDSFVPTVIGQFTNRPDLPTVLLPGPFAASILASLTWFPLEEALHLSWEMVLTMPQGAGQYRLLIDANTTDVLYCTQIARSVQATATVYRTDGGQAREQVTMPLPLSSYGLQPTTPLPSGFPYDWVADRTTVGESALAHAGSDGQPLTATSSVGGVAFTPSEASGLDQCVLNGFYHMAYMHDLFYLLGFREADGNFQTDNHGLGGIASDRVDVQVFPTPVWATASMSTPVDGVSPTMKLGLVQSTGRHTALDASVVYHEATHGLTSRLVGGALNNRALESAQSAGMGEGWSDFVACQILQMEIVGAWVTGSAGGIRQFPYDDQFPDTFANLGSGRYTEIHAIGEIWCATLMRVARAITRPRALKLFVDSLKLMPANPSFLDARDAMLLALDHDRSAGVIDAGQQQRELGLLWLAFARAGMGPNATSQGASLTGISADFNAPAATQPAWQPWARTGPVGTVPPSAAIAAEGQAAAVQLFVVGGDGNVYRSSFAGSTWAPWARTGQPGTVPPKTALAAVSAAAGGVDLYVIGGDANLYRSSFAGSTWAPWARTGQPGTVPPETALAAVSAGAGGVDLYVIGGDGNLYRARFAGGSWQPWARTGPAGMVPPQSALAAVSLAAEAVDLYVIGGDGNLYRSSFAAGSWGSWSRTGPAGSVPPQGALAAVSQGSGATELYIVGGDGNIYSSRGT
jgi:extracellular elastinolytic metalloproteinase